MAYNSISGYSTTRLTGLSSGLDTDALVQAAMTASQSKLDKLYQSKTTLEWKRDAYNDVRTKVTNFSSKFMSALSSDNIFSKNTYKQYKVSISDKYDSYFSVKGTGNAQPGSHSITKATLATKATLQGAKGRNRAAGLSGGVNTNSRASAQGTTQMLVKNADGKYEAYDPSKHSEVEVKDVYVRTSAAGSKDLANLSDNDVEKAFGTSTSISFYVNDKMVSGNKLSEIMSDVNAATKDARAKMSFEDGKITFTGTNFGSNAGITFKNGTDDLFGKNGAFGIQDLTAKIEPAVTGTTTLKELAAMRTASTQYDKDGKVINTSGLKDSDGKVEFEINGVNFKFDGDANINDVVAAVNGNKDLNVTMSFENGQFQLRSSETGGDATITTKNISGNFFGGDESMTGIAVDSTSDYQIIDRTTDTIATAASKMGIPLSSNGKLEFSINGVDFSFDKNTTLDKMMSEINASDAKARMTYSQITDSFEITSTGTGHSSTVTFEAKNDEATNFFGLDESKKGTDGKYTAVGTDAQLEIDGEIVTRSTNTFTIDGMEITIKDNFVADMDLDKDDPAYMKPSASGLGKATFSVEQDVDSVVEKMKTFVKEYNELVDALYGMTTEQKDYDYEPLTEAMREEMSDKEIEKWETEAKKGILARDTTITSFLSQMRSAIFQTVEGTGMSAYDIGFNTTKYATGEYGGKLTFDEDKFRAALQKDPERVANVMAQISDSSDAATESAESGFVTKLNDFMNTFSSDVRKLVSGSGQIQGINQKITNTSNEMDKLIQKMYEEQERLYQQYATLESLMSSYQSQSTWLTNQFSSMMGS